MDASPNSQAAELSDAPLKSITRNGDTFKRIFDIVAAAGIIIFISPIYIMIALLVKLTDPGPVFYSHRRIGRDGKSFGCLKFRTMVSNGDKVLADYFLNNPEAAAEWNTMRKLRHDPRVTAIGRILRKFSLDEIPQLLNVLRGEMSLVGPRPVMADELVHYGLNKHLYFRVRPGLTGLWQISGRSDLSYEKRVELDCQYVENWHFGHDLVIMARTIPVVCSTKGSC
ncbi:MULTISPECIES: sugar transferase [unclassified Aureimonas]|uniref:sugar transferase n=1 Tax=unclassified Aureimonas TaxID=2615206 RepID=UPI0006F6FF6C|nr:MULTISPECIES: sugar transferase [unclassified Aureimonas]KQT60482.1 exopolysaccharide biosynthesis protein [Aureimonas sp. Leaf427]KQT79359.1 exopolysaccharide biosynthesis protein [Aureimonas sp. Leaf460]